MDSALWRRNPKKLCHSCKRSLKTESAKARRQASDESLQARLLIAVRKLAAVDQQRDGHFSCHAASNSSEASCDCWTLARVLQVSGSRP